MQSFSAWLLFATAANACGDEDDGVFDADLCARAVRSPGGVDRRRAARSPEPRAVDQVEASPCGMLLIVEDGEFVRRYPEVGGEGDDGDGFHCPEEGVTGTSGTNAGKVATRIGPSDRPGEQRLRQALVVSEVPIHPRTADSSSSMRSSS